VAHRLTFQELQEDQPNSTVCSFLVATSFGRTRFSRKERKEGDSPAAGLPAAAEQKMDFQELRVR
jgi:hypothetical protein